MSNVPQISYSLYLGQKESFAGVLISAMFYGVVVVLFFQCVGALLYPVDRPKGEIKWRLVAHTVAMFSSVTIYTTMNLDMLSTCYINNREFPGADITVPGPLGYQLFVKFGAIAITTETMFALNVWLADGLLLYHCYVIYTMNGWILAFPCLMYLSTLATGTGFIYFQATRPFSTIENFAGPNFGAPFYTISFALNILLTLMIVTRIMLHSRNIRKVTGTVGGLYKAIVTMLVESAALYTVAFVLFIGSWSVNSPVQLIFFPILAEIQVIAPFLIISRVADRRASTRESTISGTVSSIRFGSGGESMVGTGAPPEGHPIDTADMYEGTTGGPGARKETMVDGAPSW